MLQDKAVRLFHAFAPMLCSRPTKKIEETVKEMGDKEFFIEEKLDGERMQLHKKGNEYFYCSRYAAVTSCISCIDVLIGKGRTTPTCMANTSVKEV